MLLQYVVSLQNKIVITFAGRKVQKILYSMLKHQSCLHCYMGLENLEYDLNFSKCFDKKYIEL